MNSKGFSLVELLTVVVIIAIISGVATVSYSSYIEESRTKTFEAYQNTMHAEAVMYFLNDTSKISDLPLTLPLSEFKKTDIKNPVDKDDMCLNSYVEVTKNPNTKILSLKYNVCLKCASYNNCKEYID